jgi:carbohydrate diacid regulator
MVTTISDARRVMTRKAVNYTPVLTARLERMAEAIAGRLAELLCAPTTVIDDHEEVIATGAPREAGSAIVLSGDASVPAELCIPLRLNEQHGMVIVGAPPNDEVISPRLAQALVDLVVSQTLALEQAPNRHQRKDSFIRDLLYGSIDDEDDIMHEASILGMDLATPRSVILIDASDYILAPASQSNAAQLPGAEPIDTHVARRAQLVIGGVVSFFHLPNDTICAYIGDGIVAVLKASNTRNLVTWAKTHDPAIVANSSWANLPALKRAGEALLKHLQNDIGVAMCVGIGRYHPHMPGITRSYEDARAALLLGRRFQNQQCVYCLDSLGTVAFVGLSDERMKIELANHLLSPLGQESDLLDTLHVFFTNNCCPSKTAQLLSVHRNTLNYRLQKIASLIGLDPRHFNEAAQIYLALLLQSAHAKDR